MSKTRIAIYTRVSTTKQECVNQLDDLHEFAAKNDWEVVEEYSDVMTGSGKKDRPGFERMMLDASKKKFDLLLFWKMDRLSREGVRKTLVHLTNLDAWCVAWRSYQEPYFDSCGAFRDVVVSIMATLASQERIAISERTKAGLRRVKAAGQALGRPAVSLDMVDVSARRARGESLRGIARELGCSVGTLVARLRTEPLGLPAPVPVERVSRERAVVEACTRCAGVALDCGCPA